MRRIRRGIPSRIILPLICALMGTVAVLAQDRDEACEQAMLVFDASISMAGRGIEETRAATRRVLPELTRQRPVGLITYGGMPGPACDTIALRLEPAPDNAAAIQAGIDALKPSGATPLTESVELAADGLTKGSRRGLIDICPSWVRSRRIANR